MDIVDIVVTILECVAIGFGMELGAVVAKVFSVRVLNGASPVTVHDVEDEEEEEDESAKRRRRRPPRGGGGPSTSTAVRVM